MFWYTDEELDMWGDLFCKHEVRKRRNLTFIAFMSLSLPARRWHIRRAALRPAPTDKSGDCRRDQRAVSRGQQHPQPGPTVSSSLAVGDPALDCRRIG